MDKPDQKVEEKEREEKGQEKNQEGEEKKVPGVTMEDVGFIYLNLRSRYSGVKSCVLDEKVDS
jgi:hypothetical protein